MPSVAERNAAFDAVKALLPTIIPSMFVSYVHDDVVLRLTDAALIAAEKERKHQVKETETTAR